MVNVTRVADGPPVRRLLELALMVAVAFTLASGIRTLVVQPYVVPSGSMEPTIQTDDRVLANKFVYRFGAPESGDIVVFDDPTGRKHTLIKRVIAIGGQTVDLIDGVVYVDGLALDEPYTHGQPSGPQSQQMPYTVPDGSVWLMGDNRTKSEDARTFGAVELALIRGKAFWTFWPIDRFGALE